MKTKRINPARLIFVFLLAVMLDHTAYFFAQFEPVDSVSILGLSLDPGRLKGWAMALVFEMSIWIMTEKLAAHMETIKTRRSTFRQRLQTTIDRFVNAYGLALVVCWSVSFVANYSHALAFGHNSTVANVMGISDQLAAMVAGGILPFVSLLFSSAIAKTSMAENVTDSELATIKTELAAANRKLAAADRQVKTLGPLETLIDKTANGKEKIAAALTLWPKMPNGGLAVIANVSPSHVTKTIQRQGLQHDNQ